MSALNLNIDVSGSATKNSAKLHGAKLAQSMGVTKHIRLGYKMRFSGVGNDVASKRFNTLCSVKEQGSTEYAHDCVYVVQLTIPVSELACAIFMREMYEGRKKWCEENNKANGYTEHHLGAVNSFIASHSEVACTNAMQELIESGTKIMRNKDDSLMIFE